SEIGYFDTYPANNNASFNGAWSNYPYFDSGIVIVSDIDRGFFALRPTFDAGFALAATPSRIAMCGDSTEALTLEAEKVGNFSEAVDLTFSGLPTGLSLTSDLMQLTPGGAAAALTLQSTGVANGTYSIIISGTATTQNKATTILLHQATDVTATALTAPADGSSDISRQPTLTWVANGAEQYVVQVSAAANFTNLLVDTTTSDATYTVAANLAADTTYYWRIAAKNACGTSAFTSASFTTRGMPTIDPNNENVLFETDVENGTTGWTLGNRWTVDTNSGNSGTKSFFAPGATFTSESILLSPEVTIPADETPAILSFWHKYAIEPNGSSACYDSAVVELSTNGGTNWQALGGNMYGDTYPNGLNEWCGTITNYRNVLVDLTDYAGQDVIIRFRYNSDASVTREGWHVDDVRLISNSGTGEQPTIIYLPLVLAP
ncbi:MAG TPA: hypothetical protein ENJ56_08335, partial [Anaerolineae bacterium]|nr:hypothetical protein [Anaerolineae bacterium]